MRRQLDSGNAAESAVIDAGPLRETAALKQTLDRQWGPVASWGWWAVEEIWTLSTSRIRRDREPLAGVRPSPVGQIVALSGSDRVYARHQWCRRLDMASDQCGVGVSGLWWVSDILRGMSLDGLVAQVGQVLGDARSLYGAAPQGGGWSSTQALSAGRDAIATAGGMVAGWGGAASSTHLAAGGGRVLALDNVIGADGATGSSFGGAADTSQSGRNGMTGVVDDTRRGVAAIAPSTDTAAGKRQLVDHLQSELDRAKSLLKVSEQRNVMLAQMIRGGAGGYGGAGSRMGGGMSPVMGGGMGGMSPMSLGAGGMPGIPNLSARTSLAGRGFPTAPSARSVGGGPLAQMAVKAALTKQGTPYVWGAKGPKVFDCSGLTQWAWGQAGVTIGPDTYTQVKQGVPVAPCDVQAGDLIFPKYSWDSQGPGHVQLAISPTEVVHAPQTGDVVRIAPMPKDFIARRPVAA